MYALCNLLSFGVVGEIMLTFPPKIVLGTNLQGYRKIKVGCKTMPVDLSMLT